MPRSVNGIEHFLLPDLGEGLTEAEVVTWRVAAGDEVALNQVLVEVETEKAVVELPSPHAGIVVELFAGVGETIAVGAPLVALGHRHAGARATRRRCRCSGATGRRRRPPAAAGPGGGTARRGRCARPRRTGRGRWRRRPCASWPASRASTWPRSPDAGRAASSPARTWRPTWRARRRDSPSPAEGTRESRASVRGVQKHMAEAMVPQRGVGAAGLRVPHARRDARHQLLAAAAARAAASRGCASPSSRWPPAPWCSRFRDYPALNSQWDAAAGEVVTRHYVNLGIAVAGPRGLVVPNIKDAHRMGLPRAGRRAGRRDGARPGGPLHAGRLPRRAPSRSPTSASSASTPGRPSSTRARPPSWPSGPCSGARGSSTAPWRCATWSR